MKVRLLQALTPNGPGLGIAAQASARRLTDQLAAAAPKLCASDLLIVMRSCTEAAAVQDVPDSAARTAGPANPQQQSTWEAKDAAGFPAEGQEEDSAEAVQEAAARTEHSGQANPQWGGQAPAAIESSDPCPSSTNSMRLLLSEIRRRLEGNFHAQSSSDKSTTANISDSDTASTDPGSDLVIALSDDGSSASASPAASDTSAAEHLASAGSSSPAATTSGRQALGPPQAINVDYSPNPKPYPTLKRAASSSRAALSTSQVVDLLICLSDARHLADGDLLQLCYATVERDMKRLTGRHCVKLAWALAKLDWRPPDERLRPLATALRRGLHECGPQHLAKAVCAFAKLGYNPGKEWLDAFNEQVRASVADGLFKLADCFSGSAVLLLPFDAYHAGLCCF